MFKEYLRYFGAVKWGGASIGVSFMRQLLLATLFLTAVGKDKYSLWLLLFNAASLITAFGNGFLHYSINYINISYHSGLRVPPLVKSIIKAAIWVILLQLVIGYVMCNPVLLSSFLKVNYSYLTVNQGRLVCLFLLLSRLLHQYSGSFIVRLFEPFGKIRKTMQLQFMLDFFEVIAIAVFIFFTKSLLLTSIAVLAVNTVFFTVMYFYVAKNTGLIAFRVHEAGPSTAVILKKSMGLNTGFLIEKTYENGLTILVSNFFGPAVVPAFNITQKMVNFFFRIASVLMQPLFPEIQKNFATNNFAFINTIIKKYWNFSLLPLMLGIIVGIPLIKVFYPYFTANILHFDLPLLVYLIATVFLQNFTFVMVEFVKKNNFSSQFVLYSLIKLLGTIVFMAIASGLRLNGGPGLGIFAAEIFCSAFALYVYVKQVHISRLLLYLLPTVLFTIFLAVYGFTGNYLLFLIPSVVQLAILAYLMVKKNNTA